MDTIEHSRRAMPALPLAAAAALLGLCCNVCGAGSWVGDWMAATNPANTNFFLGKTGIGTNNPAKQFHVLGDTKMQGGLTVDGAFQVPKQGDVSMGVFTNGVSDQGIASSNLAMRGAWISYYGDNTGVYVGTNGNVGIGTGSPGAALDVAGTIRTGTNQQFAAIAGNPGVYSGGAQLFSKTNAGVKVLYVMDSAGNVLPVGDAGFTNRVGLNAYTNTGFNLQAGGGMALRTSGGTNFFDNSTVLTSNVTYTITSGTSASGIQSIIDGIPKNLNGYTATISFNSGTYNLASSLAVKCFANGSLTFQGGTNTEVAHTNQTVILNGDTNAWCVFEVTDSPATILFNDLGMTVNTASWRACLYAQNNATIKVQGCYLYGTSTTNGYLAQTFLTRTYARYTTFANANNAFVASGGSHVAIEGCKKVGTPCTTGASTGGGVIQRFDTNSIAASDNSVWNGGLIITSAGCIHP